MLVVKAQWLERRGARLTGPVYLESTLKAPFMLPGIQCASMTIFDQDQASRLRRWAAQTRCPTKCHQQPPQGVVVFSLSISILCRRLFPSLDARKSLGVLFSPIEKDIDPGWFTSLWRRRRYYAGEERLFQGFGWTAKWVRGWWRSEGIRLLMGHFEAFLQLPLRSKHGYKNLPPHFSQSYGCDLTRLSHQFDLNTHPYIHNRTSNPAL